MEKLKKSMVKSSIIKLIIFCFITVFTTNCKKDTEAKESSSKEIVKNEIFKQVVFTKSFKNNNEVNELNINYENYSFKFRMIEDITLLQYSVDNNLISDWKQVLFNFQFLSENYDGIRLLLNNKNDSGLLLLPGYTEEYPNLIVFNFDKNNFKYLNNSDIKNDDLKKIRLENFNTEWLKGKFEAQKNNGNYILTFTDEQDKIKLNFDITESQDLLSQEDLEFYIDKVIKFENLKNPNKNLNLDSFSEFNSEIEKQGFKNILEKKCDLNQDSIEDKIVVYSTSFPKKIESDDFKEYIVAIFISNKFFQNNNIISKYYTDNVASGFNGIIVKNNYFTIEQTNGTGNGIAQEFTTFKYSNNEILLHKYTIIENQRSNGDENEKTYDYAIKNFGNILFQNYNSETIRSKCKP